MTRRQVENNIESLEQSVNTDTQGIFIVEEQPDGTFVEMSTGEVIEKSTLPENALVIVF
ncbi:hypothetical protein GLU60_04190 [Nanohaloarchaea archaeon H01]|nr:hypothetical protein [Nanohaloarchaea archaeon H01]